MPLDPPFTQRFVLHDEGLAFSCASSATPGGVRVSLTGELDLVAVPCLQALLREAETPGAVLLIDLRELAFIDCSGARLLLDTGRRVRYSGGRMLVLGSTGIVARFFALTGLDAELELVAQPADPPSGAAAPSRTRGRLAVRRHARGTPWRPLTPEPRTPQQLAAPPQRA